MLDIIGPLRDGILLSRPNRFLALVDLEGQTVSAHVPNSGRLPALLEPGKTVLVRPSPRADRRTSHDLVMVQHTTGLVSVDTRMPTLLVASALRAGLIPEMDGYDQVRPEVVYGQSRLDFRLSRQDEECMVEVKSVTLVEQGLALFPDAPTQRGTRHLRELLHAHQRGFRAVIFFVVQRRDAVHLSPNDPTDPLFGATLRDVVHRGVEAICYRCDVGRTLIRLDQRIPVQL
ncbi:MAG: DNA/RNA nuclease SfsA [Chloroflexota bacterium]|nr:MAG: DNA/RNA nuclease SfsA [Chloroflexota bacterium]